MTGHWGARSHDQTYTPGVSLRGLLGLMLLAVAGASCGGEIPASAGVPDSGGVLFEANCAECHGAEGVGTDLGPPLVHIYYEPGHHPDAAFFAAVKNGAVPHHWDFGPMPAVPGLSDEEIGQIVGHVRGLQRDAGIEG